MDDEDYEKVKPHNWYITRYGYARKRTSNEEIRKGKPSVTLMHRFIMDCDDEKDVDHINGDRLDNRKENLRICTRSQNLRNQKKMLNTSSKYKGVSWHKRDKRWRATIRYGNKNHHLGNFKSEIEAAKKYNEVALKEHGEFALLNIL